MENEEYDTIDLLEVLNAVRQHLAILILCTLAAAVVGFAVSQFAMTPQYESSALMIVNTQRPDQLGNQAGFYLQHHYQKRYCAAAGYQ